MFKGDSVEKKNTKSRIFEIIQIGNRNDLPSSLFDYFIVLVILSNIFVTFFHTFSVAEKYDALLNGVEFVTIIIFTIEYFLRIWTAEYLYPDKSQLRSKFKFIRSFYGVVDLLTILPYFLPFIFPSGAVAFRMFRVVRIFHLFRINAQYDAFNVITNVLKEKRNQLVSSVFLILVLMLASSLCMYSIEHEVQPENFSNAFSGIWWSVSTLLTVGYGDIYPLTAGGRLMAIVIAFLGVGMVAIPTGIISAGFMEYYSRINREMSALFMTIPMVEGHEYVGKTIGEIVLPRDNYIGVIVRGSEILAPDENIMIQKDDRVLVFDRTY